MSRSTQALVNSMRAQGLQGSHNAHTRQGGYETGYNTVSVLILQNTRQGKTASTEKPTNQITRIVTANNWA
jgi:hypothetical protein